jgi:hypothetical protein
MKTAILAATALMLASGSATAGSGGYGKAEHGKHWRGGSHAVHGLTHYERVKIARSKRRLMGLKRWAWADGRLSRFEHRQIKRATTRHVRLVRRLRRS